jgi:hypothetical protein
MIALESDDRCLRDALRAWNRTAYRIPAFIEKARFHRANRAINGTIDLGNNRATCPMK